MHNAYKERYKGPHVSLPEEDKHGWPPGGVGRPAPWAGQTWPGSRPGALRGGVMAMAPNHLPYVEMAGNQPPLV